MATQLFLKSTNTANVFEVVAEASVAFGNFQFELTLPSGATGLFAASTLAGWTVNAPTTAAQSLVVTGLAYAGTQAAPSLASGTQHVLGTLTFTGTVTPASTALEWQVGAVSSGSVGLEIGNPTLVGNNATADLLAFSDIAFGNFQIEVQLSSAVGLSFTGASSLTGWAFNANQVDTNNNIWVITGTTQSTTLLPANTDNTVGQITLTGVTGVDAFNAVEVVEWQVGDVIHAGASGGTDTTAGGGGGDTVDGGNAAPTLNLNGVPVTAQYAVEDFWDFAPPDALPADKIPAGAAHVATVVTSNGRDQLFDTNSDGLPDVVFSKWFENGQEVTETGSIAIDTTTKTLTLTWGSGADAETETSRLALDSSGNIVGVYTPKDGTDTGNTGGGGYTPPAGSYMTGDPKSGVVIFMIDLPSTVTALGSSGKVVMEADGGLFVQRFDIAKLRLSNGYLELPVDTTQMPDKYIPNKIDVEISAGALTGVSGELEFSWRMKFVNGMPTLVDATAEGDDDWYAGTDSDDTQDGGVGDDMLSGGLGDDSLRGGDGDDFLQGGVGNDHLDGGAGSNDVAQYGEYSSKEWEVERGDDGSFTLTHKETGEQDVLTGVEKVWFNDGQKSLAVSFSDTQDQQWGMNNAEGTSYDDVIDTDAMRSSANNMKRDWINAGAGDDHIDAGEGGDEITGGEGDDIINGGNDTTAARLAGTTTNIWELENRAIYSGGSKRYTIERDTDDANGTVTGVANQAYYTVTDTRSGSPDGTDIVFNIDAVQFTDKQVRLTPEIWVDREWDWQTQQPSDVVRGVTVRGIDYDDTQGALPGDSVTGALFAGSDRLEGNDGDDKLYGGAGGDTLRGDRGNDTLDGGANKAASTDGTHTWDPNGRDGVDVAEYNGKAERYTVTKNDNGSFTITDSKANADGVDTLTNIEVLRFNDSEKNLLVVSRPQQTWQRDPVTYTNQPTVSGYEWEGTDWSDTIDAAATETSAGKTWNDRIRDGAGDDTIKSGGGDDWIELAEGNDSVDAGTGNDTIRYDAAQRRFSISFTEDANGKRAYTVTDKLPLEFGGTGTDTLANIESLEFSDGRKQLEVEFRAEGSQNNVRGTDFDDRIDSEALASAQTSSRDWIDAGAGDDRVLAGAGGDQMQDSTGDDFYDGGANGTSQDSWQNNDQIQFSGARKRYTFDAMTYDELASAVTTASAKAASARTASESRLIDLKTWIDANYNSTKGNLTDRPVNILEVTDKLPDASGGQGVNYMVNMERVQFQDDGFDLGVTIEKWRPWDSSWGSPSNNWEGNNNYRGGILDDVMDARSNTVGVLTYLNNNWQSTTGWFSTRDWMEGGLGNDTLYGGAGADQLQGGKGNDILDGGANPELNPNEPWNTWDKYDEARFTNSIKRYDIQFYRPQAGGGYNEMGVAQANGGYVKSGYYAANGFIVVADRYSDALGGEGRDVVRNVERLTFSDAWEDLSFSYQDTSYQRTLWNGSTDQAVTVKNRWGSGTRFGDKMIGLPDGENRFEGRAGDDYLKGGNLRDELEGGKGNDTIDGGANPAVDPNRPWETWDKFDVARYQASRDEFKIQRLTDDASGTVTGTAGQTYYEIKHLIPGKLGGLGTDIVFNVERIEFTGSTGQDRDIQLDVKVAKQWNQREQAETVFYHGSIFGDSISGGSAGEDFEGNDGRDIIDAGAGNDHVLAGAGNDDITLGDGNDEANGGTGNDVIRGNAGWDMVYYDDAISRYTITVHNKAADGTLNNGTLVATYNPTLGTLVTGTNVDGGGIYTGTFGSGFTYDASTMYVQVVDSLADAYGGEGTDKLAGIEMVAFEGGAVFFGNGTATFGDIFKEELANTPYASTIIAPGTFAIKPNTFDTGLGNGTSADDTLTMPSGLDRLHGWAGNDVLTGSNGAVDVLDFYYDYARSNEDRYIATFDIEVSGSKLAYHLYGSASTTGDTPASYRAFVPGQFDVVENGSVTVDLTANTVTLTPSTGTAKTYEVAFRDANSGYWVGGLYKQGTTDHTNQSMSDGFNIDKWWTPSQGNDWLNGGLGNDTLIGGGDGTTSGSRDNYWGAGDVAQYDGAVRERLVIQSGYVDSSNHFSTSQDTTHTTLAYRVTDIASLTDKTLTGGNFNLVASNVNTGVGYGQDILVDIERIQIGITDLQLKPLTNAWSWDGSWSEGYWDQISNQWVNVEWRYPVSRSFITGTFLNDTLTGGTGGDQIDGQAGNDIIDGGADTSGVTATRFENGIAKIVNGAPVTKQIAGNEWDMQDVVRYSGSRERYIVKGVLVKADDYSIIDPLFATGTELFGIQVTDVLSLIDGTQTDGQYNLNTSNISGTIGTGQDLLVNVERVEFNETQLSIKPQISQWTDQWSGKTQVNAQGTEFDDALGGKDGDDWLSGNAGDDVLTGGAGGDEMEGGAGNDTLIGGANAAADQWGWARKDTARYNAPIDRFTIDTVTIDNQSWLRVTDSLPSDDSSSLGVDLLSGVEQLAFSDRWVDVEVRTSYWDDWQGGRNYNHEGTVFGDAITGGTTTTGDVTTHNRDFMRGGEGHDVLKGNGNGDELEGGLGNDVLDGGDNGSSGNSWQDQDNARFSGESGQYNIQRFAVTGTSTSGILSLNGAQAATVANGVLSFANGLNADIEDVIERAHAALNLFDGDHSAAWLIADSLDADLGGEGADLVFNVESINFRNGPLEIDIRADANDWDNNGTLDWASVWGTGNADTVSLASIAELTGKTTSQLAATRIDIDLREGSDVYIGGDGGESVRTGMGHDYVDGGANTTTDQWGGQMRDEVRFEGRFSRYNLINVELNKSGDTWSLSNGKGLAVSGSAFTSVGTYSTLVLADLNAAVDRIIEHAGSNTTINAWLVADRLPAEFEGSGVDVVLNVEALAFNDKWMPLEMQTWYNRAWGPQYDSTPWEQRPIVSAGVDGTSIGDTIGYSASRSTGYNYTGDDNLRGNEGNDTILGGAGGDWIHGGEGDDSIDGGANGTDEWGNPRFDTVQYDGDFDRYVITSNANGSVTVADSEADGDGTDTLTNVESISFHDRWVRLGVETWVNRDPQTQTVWDVQVNGSMLADTIDVSSDDYPGVRHFIRGNEGADLLTGGAGPDEFEGGTGDDTIIGGANGKDAWGNPGFDVARYDGSEDRYTIEYSDDEGATWSSTNPGGAAVWVKVTDSLSEADGGAGVDILQGIEALAFWDRFLMLEATRNIKDLDGDGRPDNAELIGTDSADTLTGDRTNDDIKGAKGNDTLIGGEGGDILHGGAGNDSLMGGENGTDRDGRVLIDIARYDGNYADYSIATVTGGFTVTDSDTSSGGDGVDTLAGIEGIQFADRFVSLEQMTRSKDTDKDGADDQIEIIGLDLASGGDTIAPASGAEGMTYRIIGGLGGDTLTGGTADDVFEGGAGADSITGAAGYDRARFSGNYADYTVTTPTTQGGSFTVTHNSSGSDGVDTLTGIEELVFADRKFKVVASGQTASVTTVDVDTDGNYKNDTRYVTGTDAGETTTGASNLANIMDGGAGNDTLTGGSLGDEFKPGSGNDNIVGGDNDGLDAAGNPNMDRVLYSGNRAGDSGYTIKSVQKAVFTFGGGVEAGDMLSVTVGSQTVNYTVTSNQTLEAAATAFASAVQTAVDTSTTVFTAASTLVDGAAQITLQGEDMIFAVTPAVTNGTTAVSGTFAVSSDANQSGTSLKVASATGLTVGMYVAYSVTSGSGESATTTNYGPYEITAISGTTLTLSESLGASPATGATLTVTQDNPNQNPTTVTAVTYDRWVEVSKGGETDTLRGIEQLAFDDGAYDLSFVSEQTATWGASGIVTVDAITGTGLADLVRAAAGDELFTGGAGADHFLFEDGNGDDSIADFVAGSGGDVFILLLGADDTDGINGTGVDTIAELLAKGTQQGDDTVFDLGQGHSVTLTGVRLTDLVNANFEVVETF